MKWNSIVIKLGASIIFIVLIILFPLGFIINEIFSGFYYSKIQEQIHELTNRYANSIMTLEDENILHMFELLANLTDQEIVIVDEQGIVVANSGIPSLSKGERIDANDISLLRNNSVIEKEYYDEILDKRFLSVGRPIFAQNHFIGGIFVLASIDEIHQSIHIIRNLIILTGIGAILLALGFTFIVSLMLSHPLLEMERAAKKNG